MKLRLRDDSLRLRLDRKEVAALSQTGVVESRTNLSAERPLAYRVRTSDGIGAPQAIFDDGGITVVVSRQIGRAWAESDEVGIYATTPWGLRISIEKDFRCLDAGARDEDESNAYDHPGAAAGKSC